MHREEDAAVHGLEAVAHVGDGAPDDDAHRVIEVGRAHLVLDADRIFLRDIRRFVCQVTTEVARESPGYKPRRVPVSSYKCPIISSSYGVMSTPRNAPSTSPCSVLVARREAPRESATLH